MKEKVDQPCCTKLLPVGTSLEVESENACSTLLNNYSCMLLRIVWEFCVVFQTRDCLYGLVLP